MNNNRDRDGHLLIPNILTTRKSIQQFQSGIKLSKELMNELIQVATFAPSSWNLQHWFFIVIEKQERKERLFPIVYHQQQVLDCSAVILVLGDIEAHRNAEKILNDEQKKGYITKQMHAEKLESIQRAYMEGGIEFRKEEAIRNASLASMQLMLACRDKGLDTCALRFKKGELSAELNIPDRYIPVMLICIGYASRAPKPTMRLTIEDVIIYETF